MRVTSIVAAGCAVWLAAAPVSAQETVEVRRLFEAGQHELVAAAAAAPDVEPGILYIAALSHQKIGARDAALDIYGRLAARGEGDPWQQIAASGRQLLEGDADAALATARQAVDAAESLPEAHYQLGLVLAQRRAWSEAAAAFERVAQLAPSHAYGHYYAGLMYSRMSRVDRMAIHFEQFLKLAPEAPERPEVTQIMRTVRGR